MYVDPVIVTAMGTAVTSLAGFIVYLIKYVLRDKDQQIKELAEDRDEWKNTTMSLLRTTEPLAHVVANKATESDSRSREREKGSGR